jgi:DNA-binding beta-propeller fold protein YncE
VRGFPLAPRRAGLAARTFTLALAVLALVGCAAENKPVFSALREPLVWPKPPETARILYVGELTGEASLNRPRTGGEVLRELVTGPTPTQDFATPLAVAVDGDTVHVADPACPTGPAVHVLNLATRAYSQITQAGGEPLQWPIDVAVHGSRIAIADAKRGTVYVQRGGAQTFTPVGRGTLERPASIAWARDGGELWVVDSAKHSVVVFDAGGQLRYTIGARGDRPGLFNYPTAACGIELPSTAQSADQPAIVVADAMNFRVQTLDVAGQPLVAFGRKGDAAGDFALPRDVAVDSDGHIYVLDNQFENVQVFDQQGRLLMAWGSEGAGPGQFSLPAGITIDARDRIWVADTYNRRVQVFQYVREAEVVSP